MMFGCVASMTKGEIIARVVIDVKGVVINIWSVDMIRKLLFQGAPLPTKVYSHKEKMFILEE